MIREVHMLQYSRRREDEPLPFGPVERALHPSATISTKTDPSSCAFCGNLRLEISMTPVPSIRSLYDGFCAMNRRCCGAQWTETTCRERIPCTLPMRLHPARTVKMMKAGLHPWGECAKAPLQTSLEGWA